MSERDNLDDIAEILMEAYCEAEGLERISPSYVATFVDMAEAVVREVRPHQLAVEPKAKVPLRTGVPFTAETDHGNAIELTFTKIFTGLHGLLKFEGQDVNSWLESNTLTQRMIDGLNGDA